MTFVAEAAQAAPEPMLAGHSHPYPPAGYPQPGYPPAGYPQSGYPLAGPQPMPALRYETDPFSRFLIRLWSRAPKVTAPLLVLVCFAGGVGYTLATRPADSDAAASPSCLLKLTTGFDCPGCGGTRAFWFLLHGDLPAAARSHLLAVFAVPFLVYLYLAWAVNGVFGRKLPMLRITPRAVSIFLAAWTVFAVLRNLPWAPFTWFYV